MGNFFWSVCATCNASKLLWVAKDGEGLFYLYTLQDLLLRKPSSDAQKPESPDVEDVRERDGDFRGEADQHQDWVNAKDLVWVRGVGLRSSDIHRIEHAEEDHFKSLVYQTNGAERTAVLID